jgi:hypothetical protein
MFVFEMFLHMFIYKILLTKFSCLRQIEYSKLSKIYANQEFYCPRFMLFMIFLSKSYDI